MNNNQILRSAACAALLACGLASPARASLVISEVLYNEVGSSFAGEWIEIYNKSSALIHLTDYKIGDEETKGGTAETEAMFRFPAGASIAPGEVQIVASFASGFKAVYGFAPTYEAGSSVVADAWVDDMDVPNMAVYADWDVDGAKLNMANGTDQVVILDADDNVVDALSWGNTFFLNPGLADAEGDGQSYERINAMIDTDTASDWQLVAAAPAGASWTSRSTPGTVAVPEPASLAALAAACGLLGRRRRE